MGDRGQVYFKESGVYLYTHWGAYELIKDVKKALGKKMRWEDVEYLARIVFDTMIGESQGEETGFGIGTEKHGDIWRLIEIDGTNVKVIDHGHTIFEGTFEEFLNYEPKEEEE